MGVVIRRHPFLSIFSLLFLMNGLVRSQSSVAPDEYWKEMLPNTTMPQLIKDSLPPHGIKNNLNAGLKGLKSKTLDSLTNMESLQGYEPLLSLYDIGSLKQSNDHSRFWSYDNHKSLTNNQEYRPLLSYHTKESLKHSNDYSQLWSYDKTVESAASNIGHYSFKTNNYYLVKYFSDVKNTLFAFIKSYTELLIPYNKRRGSLYESFEGVPVMDHSYFVEKDLHVGMTMNLHFRKSTNKAIFLPREISKSIPFSWDKLQEIMTLLSINPISDRANELLKRIKLCEQPTMQGIDKHCVTSLESMIDFVISKIGKNVSVMSNTVEKDVKTEFMIQGVTQVASDHNAMVCHKMDYPYGLFYCHRSNTIRAYEVTLVNNENGIRLENVATCHKETTSFVESYVVNVLKIKPGSSWICHFPDDAVIWVPY